MNISLRLIVVKCSCCSEIPVSWRSGVLQKFKLMFLDLSYSIIYHINFPWACFLWPVLLTQVSLHPFVTQTCMNTLNLSLAVSSAYLFNSKQMPDTFSWYVLLPAALASLSQSILFFSSGPSSSCIMTCMNILSLHLSTEMLSLVSFSAQQKGHAEVHHSIT